MENNISLRQSRNAHLSGLEDTYTYQPALYQSLSGTSLLPDKA